MKILKQLNKLGGSNEQFLLSILLIIYILVDVPVPAPLANMIDSITGNIVIGLIAVSIFVNGNPLIGILGLLATYMLIKRSGNIKSSKSSNSWPRSEDSKVDDFSKYNDFPVSLEEEIVQKMAPLVKHSPAPNSDYKPILAKLHNAAPTDYTGVI